MKNSAAHFVLPNLWTPLYWQEAVRLEYKIVVIINNNLLWYHNLLPGFICSFANLIYMMFCWTIWTNYICQTLEHPCFCVHSSYVDSFIFSSWRVIPNLSQNFCSIRYFHPAMSGTTFWLSYNAYNHDLLKIQCKDIFPH